MELVTQCPVCQSDAITPFLECKDHFLSGETFSIVECGNCSFRFTNPRPEADQLGRYYQSPEYISHSNSRKGFFNRIYQAVRKYTLWQKYRLISDASSGKKILDIGCASGEFLRYMQMKGWETAGIEPDRATREKAVQQYKLKIFDETELSIFPEAHFDVITLWHVLEHVSDLNARMQQLSRLLKASGTLIIAVPNAESLDAISYGPFWAGYDVPRHLYHFTADTMKRLLDRYAFQLVRIRPMKFDAFYVSLLSEKYKQGKLRWIPGFWQGLRSNVKASGNGNYSSLIFISRKAPAGF